MGDLILSAGFFTGESTEKFVCFNQSEVDAMKDTDEPVEASGAYFDLIPVDGKLDAEYTKMRGQDVKTMRVRPRAGDSDDTGPNVDFEPMEMSFSNEREIKAMAWLFKKVVKGWRRVMLDDGTELPFNEKNVEIMGSIPQFARPVLEAAYGLATLQKGLLEGNFETS